MSKIDFADLPEFTGVDDAPSDPRQKALHDLFISEYLIDFNATDAAQRCGFAREFAIEYGQRLMASSYVMRRIKELQLMKVDEAVDSEFNKTRIKSALIREAHYHGPGSSQSARVAALTQLAKLYGMEAPKKSESTVTHRGGVMAVPCIAKLDEWEAVAEKSQKELISDARK